MKCGDDSSCVCVRVYFVGERDWSEIAAGCLAGRAQAARPPAFAFRAPSEHTMAPRVREHVSSGTPLKRIQTHLPVFDRLR